MPRRILKVILWGELDDDKGGAYRMLDASVKYWPESKVGVYMIDGVAYVVTLNKKSVTVRRNV